jgi:hypothetical protein
MVPVCLSVPQISAPSDVTGCCRLFPDQGDSLIRVFQGFLQHRRPSSGTDGWYSQTLSPSLEYGEVDWQL